MSFGWKVLIPLAGLIDKDAELARLQKEIDKLETEVKRLNGKLSNANFVDKAPEAVVNKEREKLADAEAALAEIFELDKWQEWEKEEDCRWLAEPNEIDAKLFMDPPGEKLTFEGEHYVTDRAKLYSPPMRRVPIYLAAGGPKSAALAGEMADGVITSPREAAAIRALPDAAGRLIVTPGVRSLTPFFNLYGTVTLVGGAAWSAWIFFTPLMINSTARTSAQSWSTSKARTRLTGSSASPTKPHQIS